METFTADTLFRVVDVTGVIANGLLGAALARKKHFDPIGFMFLAITSGLGGGLIRDVLLNVRPVAFTDPIYLAGALAAAGVGFLVTLRGRWLLRALLLFDVLALGCWSATGAAKALGLGLGAVPAILLGVTTAIGGGVLRDILVMEVPAVFGFGTPLYATPSILASVEMVILTRLGHAPLGMGLAIVICGVVAGLSRWRGWTLPVAADITLPGVWPSRRDRADS